MVSLIGNNLVVINDRIFRATADADYVTLDFPNDLTNIKVSKEGNTIFAMNQTGNIVIMTMRLLRGSADDIFLNSLIQSMRNDFSGFTLLTGSFTKRVGDGAGNIVNEIYTMSNGVFKKVPGGKASAEGDTEQSVAVYEIWFYNNNRAMA